MIRRLLSLALASVMVLSVGCNSLAPLLPAVEPRAAALLPADTWLYVSFTTRPGLAQALNVRGLIDTFQSQPGFAEAWAELEKDMADGEEPVDLEGSVLPLIQGEMALAAFGSVEAFESNVVLLVQSADADRLIRALAQGQTLETTPGPHGSVFYANADSFSDGIVAAYNGWVIGGPRRDVVEMMIDRVAAGSAGLADEARFQAVMGRLPQERVGSLYVDAARIYDNPEMRRSIEALGGVSGELIDQARVDYAMALVAAADGLEMPWVAIRQTPRLNPGQWPRGDALAVFDRLPADTLVAVTGDNLHELLSESTRVLLAAIESQGEDIPGLDLLDEAAGWFAGDFAFGVGPGTFDPRLMDGDPSALEMTFVARVADMDRLAALTEEALAKRPDDADLWPVPVEINGYQLREFTTREGAVLTFGLVDDWQYVTLGDAQKALDAVRVGGVRTNPRYTQVSRVLVQNGSNTFVDLQGVRERLEALASPRDRRDYDPRVRPFLVPMRAIGSSAVLHPNGDGDGTILLTISS